MEGALKNDACRACLPELNSSRLLPCLSVVCEVVSGVSRVAAAGRGVNYGIKMSRFLVVFDFFDYLCLRKETGTGPVFRLPEFSKRPMPANAENGGRQVRAGRPKE